MKDRKAVHHQSDLLCSRVQRQRFRQFRFPSLERNRPERHQREVSCGSTRRYQCLQRWNEYKRHQSKQYVPYPLLMRLCN